jgi:hypothetical protein
MEINHNHCTSLHAYNGDEKKKLQNKAMEAIVKKNVEKTNLEYLDYPCCQTNL